MAEDLGGSGRPRPRGLHVDQAGGRAGRTIRWASGRTPQIPEAVASAMRAGVTPGPAGCGLDRAHGTSAARATPLDRLKGLAVRASTRRLSGTKPGGRPERPTSRDRNADPARQAAATQDRQALQKRRRRGAGPAAPSRGAFCAEPTAAPAPGAQRAAPRWGQLGGA
jgi:hypothetical protein